MRNKHVVVGIVAPVDAGKTTLSESLLYQCKMIRRQGRVDHKDAFLDTDEMERARGITIFSKQAKLNFSGFFAGFAQTFPDIEQYANVETVSLLDTPGHVDFSAEMERTLQVLDYAILLVSGADGIEGHVLTLWKLLRKYQVPTFIFVNKMDQPDTDKEKMMQSITERLSSKCVDFTEYLLDGYEPQNFMGSPAFFEEIALCDEDYLERFLNTGLITKDEIAGLIAGRKLVPVFFGAALKNEGIIRLLCGMAMLMVPKQFDENLSYRVFKITRDENKTRLTWVKVLGDKLKVKLSLPKTQEKIEQLRIYSGAGYTLADEVMAGEVCAVVGLNSSYIGQVYGDALSESEPILQPVLTYRLILPDDCDPLKMMQYLQILEEEDPMLMTVYEEKLQEIHLRVMGEVQLEILKNEILRRFGISVSFGEGSIVYKETILEPVEGIGHFEPLRHYAEVHLLLEPMPLGSGIQCDARVSTDVLALNWQKQVLHHMTSRRHRGVLTGGELTDVRITLIAGKAHLKHTEGGDFRQATYRAIRQGLMCAKSRLLEPFYSFVLEIPSEYVGRAIADLMRMSGEYEAPVLNKDMAKIVGRAPVSCMHSYAKDVVTYTKGFGHIYLEYGGYGPCHNEEEVLNSTTYDPERDLGQPTGSVFCAHGAGFVVPWNEVQNYMHIAGAYDFEKESFETDLKPLEIVKPVSKVPEEIGSSRALLDELDEIFKRTYGEKKKTVTQTKRVISAPEQPQPNDKKKKEVVKKERYLLIDGYNFLFYLANENSDFGVYRDLWKNLKELSKTQIQAARDRFIDILDNYGGFTKKNIILVYDAYKVKKNPGEVTEYPHLSVVYTKEAETADQYIEKTVHRIVKNAEVVVATSDYMEQKIIFGAGATRMSSRELRLEIDRVFLEIAEFINN